jgi:hypothetical protein
MSGGIQRANPTNEQSFLGVYEDESTPSRKLIEASEAKSIKPIECV